MKQIHPVEQGDTFVSDCHACGFVTEVRVYRGRYNEAAGVDELLGLCQLCARTAGGNARRWGSRMTVNEDDRTAARAVLDWMLHQSKVPRRSRVVNVEVIAKALAAARAQRDAAWRDAAVWYVSDGVTALCREMEASS